MANTLSVHYPEIWSKFLVNRLEAESVMLPLVNRQLEAEMGGQGDIVHRQKVGAVTVSAYTDGTDFSDNDVTSTDATLTIDQKYAFHFIIDAVEMALSTNKVNLVKAYTDQARIEMAQTVDDHLLGKHSSIDSGNVIGADSAGVTLTKDNIYNYGVELYKLLAEDNIPREGGLCWVVGPAEVALMKQSNQLTHATAKGDMVISKGHVGEFAGFDIVQSNRITAASSVRNLMAFNKDLFCDFVMRIPPENFDFYKPEKQFGQGVKGLAVYGSNVFHSTAGALLKAAA